MVDVNVLDRQIQAMVSAEDESSIDEFDYELCIEKAAEERLLKRVKIWSSGDVPSEWAAIGTGRMQNIEDEGHRFTMLYVDDFIDLPAYNVYRQHSITFSTADISKIAANSFPILMVHTHTEGEEFSQQDIAQAMGIDSLIGRPLIHVLINAKGSVKLLHFFKCRGCPHSPFRGEKRAPERRR